VGVLTIRNVDDEVIAALKARAKANHRSLEGELRHLLSRYAVPDSNLGLMRERVRAAYGPAPGAQQTVTDPPAQATDPCPDDEAERVEWLGMMRDVTEITGDIISPASELSDWNVYRSDAASSEEDDEAP
jgi:plasmid stability protein